MNTTYSHNNMVQISTDYDYFADRFTVRAAVYQEVLHIEDGYTFAKTEIGWERTETCDSKAWENGRVDELVEELSAEAERRFAELAA